jgi:hypothetical protein
MAVSYQPAPMGRSRCVTLVRAHDALVSERDADGNLVTADISKLSAHVYLLGLAVNLAMPTRVKAPLHY